MDMDMDNMDMDMDRVSTPPYPTLPHYTPPHPHPTPTPALRPNARHCGSRRNAITDHRNPTPEECASDQEQMCSGSRDQRSTGD